MFGEIESILNYKISRHRNMCLAIFVVGGRARARAILVENAGLK